MRTLVKVLCVAGLAALLVGTAGAQEQKRQRGQKGGGGFGQPGRGMGGGMLLGNESVQKELNLTEDQVAKVKERATKMMEEGRERFAGLRELGEEERREKMQAIMKETEAANKKFVEEVLQPEQQKRFKQIEIQTGGLQAFARPDVQSAMKFSDEQKDQLKTITEDVNKERRELFQGGGFGDREKMAENMKKMEAINKEAMDKVKGLLTADQKKAWEELTGKPFKLVQQQRRRDI
jgi:hypothetical protein